MNDALCVYLNLDVKKERENEELIRRIDSLLLTVGMKYSGIMNMYVAVDNTKRDQAFFQAEQLLRDTDWLKGILAYTMVATITNACSIEEIRTDRMSNPSPEKLWYYERYYQKSKKLPHAIVVDENKQLRDGYISYLLAEKYDARAEVYEALSEQPLRKIVKGSHVEFSDGKWRKKGDKQYIWIYTLKAPVVPGDILLVNTGKGPDFMCVGRIDYITGSDFCSKYRKVEKHMNMYMEEREDTDCEK